MRTNEILSILLDNGGFTNWMHWSEKECAEYVLEAFDCSRYVAKNVAREIVRW